MELLKPGSPVPGFALPDVRSGRRVEYASFLRKRRIVLLLWDASGQAWFAKAVKQAREFAERDLTVLAITREAEKPAAPAPTGFHLLLDENGAITERLGGASAFYLVGKDTGIKTATRTPLSLPELFRTIDAMPMRAQEMRAKGN